MRNPPDFVMYVVMVRLVREKTFHPLWRNDPVNGACYAEGFHCKKDAAAKVKYLTSKIHIQAYMQQYGPIS